MQFSEFFRTPGQFNKLAQDILPKLLAQRPELRVWSAGCSYGAEPYTIALLLQQLAANERHFILATDVDQAAIARASAADSFTEHDVRHVPAELRGWFRQHGWHFKLDPEIAARVTFMQHDLLESSDVILSEAKNRFPHARSTDSSGAARPQNDSSSFDLIICRNVMMYFTMDARNRLLDTLHSALRPGGYLFVGDAEVVNDLSAAGFTQELTGFYRKVLV